MHTLSGTLISFAIHAVLLILLAFFVYSTKKSQSTGLTAELVEVAKPIAERPAEDPEVTINMTEVENDNSVIENEAVDNALSDEAPTPTISDSDTKESAENNAPVENNIPEAPNQPSFLGGGLQGRDSGARASLAAKYGGTSSSELAVENGLKWLANHQFPDGSWRLYFSKGPCAGQCKNDGTSESTTAATGLTLMAFLGAGYTHRSGPYQQQIQDGLDYLKSRLRKSIFGGRLTEGNKAMYSQGIATIALSEAYSMTRDENLRETIESAIEYIVTAQHSRGGWRYSPGEPGDTTVTGWQVMALKSAEMAGIEVPAKTIRQAKKFLASVSDSSSGHFGYMDKKKEATSTAIGLLLEIYLGRSIQHRGLTEGSRYISKLGPSANNIYFNYYATLLMFHMQHESWDQWNQEMRDYLIQTQEKNGHQSGSWYFKERYGSVGGRLYTTAMAIMILEVYYRYLPLFDPKIETANLR